MKSWFTARLGQFRVSTIVLIVVFLALFWVQQNVQPQPAPPEEPAAAVVPPGFVPDPNYTWVPRTQVRRPKEPTYTTTTPTPTTTTETTTPGPDDATTSPTETPPSPTTTVIDPDGPGGPLGPQTLMQTPTVTAPTTPPPVPGTVPATPEAPR
ncbi:hypothetical protein [Mycolicibacterium sp. 120270]|uniref:hypothetical protein n=1 Tax=Mycolicibacterium sp. 120270 TaxID=3090600 RepID=UPI00299E0090|nr:hypothetical protein [Mycolicibacterium sp. 120270]MDX1883892.1 hypothetical protein [Mycolicibacterium sp. 120270]